MADEPGPASSNARTDAPATEDARLKAAEAFIEQEEGATSRYRGLLAAVTTTLLVVMSLFHLYAAVDIVTAQVLRPLHVGFALVLVFLLFPVAARFRHRLMPWDVVLASPALATIAYLLAGGDEFWDRNVFAGHDGPLHRLRVRSLLVLEACRRTSGWILPGVVAAVPRLRLLRALLPAPWTHRGYDIASLTGILYQTLEGIFGTAVDVSATLIILFTIYGAILQHSGAGKFFLDFSFAAMGGKRAGAGPHRGAVVVPARRSVRLRRRDDRHARLGRLADADARRLRARTPRAGCSRPAGSARSSRRRCSARPRS